MTWAQIRTRVKSILNEPSTGGTWDDTTDYLVIANEIQLDIVNDTSCFKGQRDVTLTSSNREFNLSSEILRINSIFLVNSDSTTRRLQHKTVEWLSRHHGDWATETGDSIYWYDTRDGIGVYPYSACTIRIDYTMKPEDMSDDADTPFNDYTPLYPYHKLLIWGIIDWFYLERGESKNVDLSRFLQRYERGKALLRRATQQGLLSGLDAEQDLQFEEPPLTLKNDNGQIVEGELT